MGKHEPGDPSAAASREEVARRVQEAGDGLIRAIPPGVHDLLLVLMPRRGVDGSAGLHVRSSGPAKEAIELLIASALATGLLTQEDLLMFCMIPPPGVDRELLKGWPHDMPVAPPARPKAPKRPRKPKLRLVPPAG